MTEQNITVTKSHSLIFNLYTVRINTVYVMLTVWNSGPVMRDSYREIDLECP